MLKYTIIIIIIIIIISLQSSNYRVLSSSSSILCRINEPDGIEERDSAESKHVESEVMTMWFVRR